MRAALAVGIAGTVAVACVGTYARPATYEAELVACNRTAKTLDESLACEDAVRDMYGRPRRGRDAGAPRAAGGDQ